MAQPIPQELAHLVALNVEFNILICLQCKIAVTPGAIIRHLGDRHKTNIELRKQVDQYIQEFPFKYDHKTVVLPKAGLCPQPIIPIVNGFQCKQCPFITQNRAVIKQHGNKKHQKQRVPDTELYHRVRIQSWFDERRARYWTVDESKQREQERQARRNRIRDVGEESDDNESHSSHESHSEGEYDETQDPIIQEIEKWQEEAQERRLRLLKDVPKVEMDSWLQYTKWNEVFSGTKHNFIKIFQFTRMPDPDEPQLDRLIRAWNRILERCLNTLEDTDHKDVLKWWSSPQNEAASQRPFELPQNAKTIDKYSEIWIRFICYIMRTAPTESATDETGMYTFLSS